MCGHNETIEDYSSGDLICVHCGLVLDKIFLHSNTKEYNEKYLWEYSSSNALQDEVLRKNVIDFFNMINIHHFFLNETVINVKKLLLRFTHFPLSLVIASACFVTLSKNDFSIALGWLEDIVCKNKREKKNLFKMIVSIHQPTLYSNLSECVAHSMLQGLNLPFSDIETIKKNMIELKCKYCTYSPLTVVASHTFLFLKCKCPSTTLTSICQHLGVSKTSVYSYINIKRHQCVTNWYHVYNQLSHR